jgi:DHA2 family multidrug resistance protein
MTTVAKPLPAAAAAAPAPASPPASPLEALTPQQKVLAFATMCVGMFIALLDIQIRGRAGCRK